VTYITERCVLRLTADGLRLTEVAPGVDARRDVIEQIPFPITVADDLQTMPRALFSPQPFGLTLERGDD